MEEFEIILESENILYIRVNEKLVYDYLEMINDLEIQKLISTKIRIISLKDELEWIKNKLEERKYVFSMLERETGNFIGNIELMDFDGTSAELGITITKNMQNKHYGTEAMKTIIEYSFSELRLECLNAVVFSNNRRSLHCCESLGFIRYKIDKNVVVINNKEIDDIYLRLNRK